MAARAVHVCVHPAACILHVCSVSCQAHPHSTHAYAVMRHGRFLRAHAHARAHTRMHAHTHTCMHTHPRLTQRTERRRAVPAPRKHARPLDAARAHAQDWLHWSAYEGKEPLLRACLARGGIKADCFNDEGLTPLHLAVHANSISMVGRARGGGGNLQRAQGGEGSNVQRALTTPCELRLRAARVRHHSGRLAW